MSILEKMEKAAVKELKVRAVCGPNEEYVGTASHFSNAVDEEEGFATFCIWGEKNICLGENEIIELEILE